MKKILLILITLIGMAVMSSCMNELNSTLLDEIYESRSTGHDLYYSTDFDSLTTYKEISDYITSKVVGVKDGEVDTWQNPERTLIRGKGDCDDMALLFINIAYFSLGEKLSLVLIEEDDIVTREAIEGGDMDHATPYDGEYIILVEHDGRYGTAPIKYLYTFDLIFNME